MLNVGTLHFLTAKPYGRFGGDRMKRFPKSKGRIQALNICIMQYTAIESHGYDSFTWLLGGTDTFGDPLVCTRYDIEWAMDYLWERCQKVSP